MGLQLRLHDNSARQLESASAEDRNEISAKGTGSPRTGAIHKKPRHSFSSKYSNDVQATQHRRVFCREKWDCQGFAKYEDESICSFLVNSISRHSPGQHEFLAFASFKLVEFNLRVLAFSRVTGLRAFVTEACLPPGTSSTVYFWRRTPHTCRVARHAITAHNTKSAKRRSLSSLLD